MIDLYIDLPLNTPSQAIPINKSMEDREDDLLQRAVTLMLLRKDPELQYNGDSVLRLLRKSTSGFKQDVQGILGPIGEALKLRLNAEEVRVRSVYFSFGDDAHSQDAELILTINKTDGGTVSTVLA